MAGNYALVFPGQGSQRVGMLEPLKGDVLADRLLGLAEEATGLPLREVAESGPDERLADTRFAQPLLFIADVAWGMRILGEAPAPLALAGHSLGELAALAVSGVLNTDVALHLVIARSSLMADAAAASNGAMAAVIGLDRETISSVLQGASGVWVANDNAPGQVVISGLSESVDSASERLQDAGARRVLRLNVAGAFHSPLMQSAADAFSSLLDDACFADARYPLLQNTDPAPLVSGGIIRERLRSQITSPVRWTETMNALVATGVSFVVEAGPGAVLSGLAKRVDGLTGLAIEQSDVSSIVTEVSS